jgi:heterodisulfide reductase subunit C
MKKTIRFLLETTESISIRRPLRTMSGNCVRCGTSTRFETPEAISIKTGLAEREIFRLVERDAVDFIEGDRIFVCTSCLKDASTKNAAPAGPFLRLGPAEPET